MLLLLGLLSKILILSARVSFYAIISPRNILQGYLTQ